jgi:integrase
VATIKRLPSGKWQAVVWTPVKLRNGRPKRISKTHSLKRVVEDWADVQEGAIASGTWSPRAAAGVKRDLTLGEYRQEWVTTRIADGATSDKNESQWRTHVEPVWAGYPLSLITRPDIKAWVHRMHTEQCKGCKLYPGVVASTGMLKRHKRPSGEPCSRSGKEPGLGAWTVQGAAAHLSGLLTAAVEDGKLDANPAVKLSLPTAAPKPIFYWTRDEAARLLLELGGADALAVDLNMHIGLRPGELFGMKREFVDLSAWLIHVHGVATRRGWRPYAKTSMSHRAVPVPTHLRERLLAHVLDLAPDDLVFPGPEGGLQNDRNYAQRVFVPALKRAGVRTGTPYGMRHTAASWLVQLGVPLLDVQRLLGHEKYSTTLRYAHLAPGQFGSVVDAWGTAALDPRGSPRTPSVPHEPSMPDR